MGNIIFLDWKLGIFTLILGIIAVFLFYKSFGFGQKFKFFEELQKAFGTGKWILSGYMILSLILVGIFSLIVSNPNYTFTQTQTSKNGIDIVLVLDLSYSMLAEDISPNRLEKSKEVLQNFISKIETDRVGMVVFAGKPFAGFPLTHDYSFVKKYVDRMSVETINQNFTHLQGTAVGEGLLYGENLFDDNADREKVIVLLSDGKPECGDLNNDGKMDCMNPINAVRYIREKNITIHTVGIGGEGVTKVTFSNGAERLVTFDKEAEDNLKFIADSTGGKYFRASDEKTFAQLFDELNLLTKKDIIISQTTLYSGAYREIWYFGFFVFFVFFLYFSWFYIKN